MLRVGCAWELHLLLQLVLMLLTGFHTACSSLSCAGAHQTAQIIKQLLLQLVAALGEGVAMPTYPNVNLQVSHGRTVLMKLRKLLCGVQLKSVR